MVAGLPNVLEHVCLEHRHVLQSMQFWIFPQAREAFRQFLR